MLAKLMAGGTGYDVIMPTEYIMKALVDGDFIDKVDTNLLPNVVKNFDKKFASEWSLRYDVPYAFSCTGIIWKKDKVPSDLTFEDWNDLFDSRLNGHICIMNDIREVLGIALKMNGYSVNSTNDAELKKATELAKTWKNKCEKMDNEAYRTGIPAGEFYAAMAYNSDAIQLVVDEGDAVAVRDGVCEAFIEERHAQGDDHRRQFQSDINETAEQSEKQSEEQGKSQHGYRSQSVFQCDRGTEHR
jgi:spermidine/putrescine transport system substrate-binding protein